MEDKEDHFNHLKGEKGRYLYSREGRVKKIFVIRYKGEHVRYLYSREGG